MARSGKTAQEFIQSSFSPIIAVLCSSKVENVVSKNNLTFTELLQPFTFLDLEGQFREPSGSVCIIKNWKLIIRDVNWKPLQPTEARRQLNNAVLHNHNDKTVSLELEGRRFEVSQSTPWFDAWRETYLEVQFPSDHEFTKHFLSCIIVGTTYDENIVDTFNTLNQQYAQLQNVTPPKLPKWFNNEILKTYLLLHDVSTIAKDKADAAYEALKQNFGASNCFMLSINSKSTLDPSLPTDYWATFIKRSSETNTEMASSLTTTPLEPHQIFPPSIVNPDDNNVLTPPTNSEAFHPLTSTENEIYDNANNLQTHSFSGSSESVSVSGKLLDFSTEIHGAALNANDVDGIKKFLQEYATKALLPHMEKLISQLSEGVATRKGVSRSLISATKRWFGTGKSVNTTVNNTVIYAGDCQELQLRRLGDLWFLCGQWQRAFDAYHTAKREFYADSAWLCYAGALEMAAISAFMAGESNRKTHGYMEESIVTYLNTCRMVQYAVRATLLSVLCLSSSGLHGEAAKQLIRMTSEDSDLRSAMLLEQAALCFLSGPGTKAMCRKYAFHMVLAGHRFSKAGQKKHAYRCYKQAYQVYIESGWRLATDHVQFALGRLAGALRLPQEAVRWLSAPLAPHSLQPPHQQTAFLREYMLAHQQWLEYSDEFKDRLPLLPIPLLESEATTVLCVGPAPLSSPGRVPATSLNLSVEEETPIDSHYWNKMEEMLLQVAQGSVPMIFKPTNDLYSAKTDSNPIASQGEPIQISITLRNPLKVCLVLKDVELLWQFAPSSVDEGTTEILNNEPAVAAGNTSETNVIYGQKIKSMMFEGDCKKVLSFSLTPLRVGTLSIQGLAYKLLNAGESGNENGSVFVAGKLNLVSGVNITDKRLQITVIPEAPCLQMTFSETSPDVISGEMRTIDVEMRNVGPVDMRNVYIAVSHPDCISLVTSDNHDDDFKDLYNEKYRQPAIYTDERAARLAAWRSVCLRHVCCAVPSVASGGAARAHLLLRPRAHVPALCLLAYYETGNRTRPYRLLRHVFRYHVTEAVELSVTPQRSIRTVEGNLLENMNLAVEVKNVSNEKDSNISVEILEASLLSTQWSLTDLTAARNKDHQLTSHERVHLIFKARRIFDTLPDGKINCSHLKVANSYRNTDGINRPPYSKFVMECKSSYLDTTEPIVQEQMKNRGLIRSMFVLRWKAHDKTKDRTAIGQHALWLNCFTRAESSEREFPVDIPALQFDELDSKTDLIDTKKNNKDNAVVFRLEHLAQVNHNFKQRKLCLVPITINIVNCYDVAVRVFIDMSKKQNRESFDLLGWAGALSSTDTDSKELGVSVELDKYEARRVQVRAVCAAPGTYLVGSAFVVTTYRVNDNQPLTHTANNTSLLIVEQS